MLVELLREWRLVGSRVVLHIQREVERPLEYCGVSEWSHTEMIL